MKTLFGVLMAAMSLFIPHASPPVQTVQATSTPPIVTYINIPVSAPVNKPIVGTHPSPTITPEVISSSIAQTSAPVSTAPVEEQFYENGSLVSMTDAQHQALLQQKTNTLQDLEGKIQYYVSDMQNAEDLYELQANKLLQKDNCLNPSINIGLGRQGLVDNAAAQVCEVDAQSELMAQEGVSMQQQQDQLQINQLQTEIQEAETYN